MCGRFYIDEDTAEEIRRVVEEVDRKKRERMAFHGDVRPTEKAILFYQGTGGQAAGQIQTGDFQWGFVNQDKKLMINARSETVWEKPMFRNAMEGQRCVVPASGFYEWTKDTREKYCFSGADEKILYLAGLYHYYEGEGHFVILTRSADELMAPIHDRMPVVFTKNTWREWLMNSPKEATEMLSDGRVLLKKEKVRLEFEQMKFF